MADAGVRQASADRTAALITADEMVFIDNPPNAGPIEHSTPGVDGELAPPRVALIKSAKALKKVEEPRRDERGLASRSPARGRHEAREGI